MLNERIVSITETYDEEGLNIDIEIGNIYNESYNNDYFEYQLDNNIIKDVSLNYDTIVVYKIQRDNIWMR